MNYKNHLPVINLYVGNTIEECSSESISNASVLRRHLASWYGKVNYSFISHLAVATTEYISYKKNF